MNLSDYGKNVGRMAGSNMNPCTTQPKSRPVVCAAPSSAEITEQAKAELTTVMLRNIPNRYTQSMLLEVLIEQGFRGLYDFVYLPMDFRNGVNLGYAFVNLITNEDALNFMLVFQGFSKWFVDSVKVCEVSWAHPHQGRHQHVERYRNSPVMHPSMPDDYKPMVFKKGMRVPFPPPTKVIRAPKLRPIRDRAPSGSGTPPTGVNRTAETPNEQQGPHVSNTCPEVSQKCDHFIGNSQPHVPAAWGG
jgi:RNA recognition motif-containing protein